MQRLPFNGYLWQWLLQHTRADELDALLEDAYRLLPLAELASGPEDNLGLGPDYAADSALQVIIQGLQRFPGAGWPLVAAALNNPVTRSRNGALRVLDAWPTDDWPDAAREALVQARDAEPSADVRQRIQALLDDGKLTDGL